jgi:hypothetical protein
MLKSHPWLTLIRFNRKGRRVSKTSRQPENLRPTFSFLKLVDSSNIKGDKVDFMIKLFSRMLHFNSK